MGRGNIYTQEFFEAYDKENGFDITTLRKIIDNSFGESNELDFKEKFIREDKIAKTILAMANSGGGTIIFGVSNDLKPIGIDESELKDPTNLETLINSYLPSNLNYYNQPIFYKEDELYGDFSGKKFYIFHIYKQYRYAPFIAKHESDDIKPNRIYVRKNTSNSTATNEDLEIMFKKRLYEQYEDLSNLDLEEHIDQLRILYKSIQKTKQNRIIINIPRLGSVFPTEEKENIYYPSESLDEFVSRMIDKKKRKIEITLEVSNIE